MSINKRTPMTSLRPLSQAAQDFLFSAGFANAVGAGAGYYKAYKYRVWWSSYFTEADPDEPGYTKSRDLDAYTNPYTTLGEPHVYVQYTLALQRQMSQAQVSLEAWKKMKLDKEFPPDPDPRDPYKLPAYFGWVQAEVAFRRGYMLGVEEIVANALKRALKESDDFAPETLVELAGHFRNDPIVRDYFTALAEIYSSEKMPENVSTRALFDDIMRKRERAYQQFSPYFYPHRSVHGAGFSGFGKRGFR